MVADVASIAAALGAHGLILRGGFAFADGEDRPAGPSGAPASAVLMIGNAGAAFWQQFRAWRATRPADLADPLDTWSREIAQAIAGRVGARPVMPSDRPYVPFQRWAMRAEGLRPSPLGLLIHPEYGLWHAYRAALLLDAVPELPPKREPPHPCDRCVTRPCLSTCPVGAHSTTGFDAGRCRAHAGGSEGGRCRMSGCLARNACPVGDAWRQEEDQQAFHMAAFLKG